MTMSKRERIEATFAKEPVDRPPVSLWRHWPIDETRGPELACATLTFQQTYDFDFIKVTPSSDYPVAGYGTETTWTGNGDGTLFWGKRVIQTLDDWAKLRPLDPTKGLLGEVIEANRLVGQAVGEDVPFIITIFNPLTQAKNLAGDRLLSDLRQHPDVVREALNVLHESNLRFIDAVKDTGVAGIFLAMQQASYDLMTVAEYEDFGKPHDLETLAATEGMWFRLIHLHGTNVMFDVVADYPAEIINWHDLETPPSLGEGQARTKMAVCGGLRQWDTMVRGTPEQVQAEADAAIEATGGRGFMLGTGCVTPVVAPTANIVAARRAVDLAAAR